MENKMKKLGIAGAIAALLATGLALVAGPVLAGGLYTNGLPQAGSTPYSFTYPLTGNELLPLDTQLPGGQSPQTESVSVNQLMQSGYADAQYTANAATASTTATAASMTGKSFVVLDMTGTLAAAGNLTTPTAAQLIAANPNFPLGGSYTLRVINETAATDAWTLVGGTGVTVSGTATISAASFTDFLVTFTSATVVGIQRVGSGTK